MKTETDIETRLNNFLGEQLRLLNGQDLPGCLYHYTSTEGMLAIISSGVLRAHNLGQMNDVAEGCYAASVMRAHVDRSYAIEPNMHATALLGAIRQQQSAPDLTNVFALSFTTDGDELGMWRLYSDRGRGFSFAIPIREALGWAGIDHSGMMLKCCYDPSMLTLCCVQTLAKIREIYLESIAGGYALGPETVSEIFLHNISYFAPAFKPSVWQDEKEWRFVFLRQPLEHKTLQDHRTFVELPLTLPEANQPSPIVAICAGPDCDYEDSVVPVQRMLLERGYGQNYPIHVSAHHTARPGRRPPVMRPDVSA